MNRDCNGDLFERAGDTWARCFMDSKLFPARFIRDGKCPNCRRTRAEAALGYAIAERNAERDHALVVLGLSSMDEAEAQRRLDVATNERMIAIDAYADRKHPDEAVNAVRNVRANSASSKEARK